MYRPAACLSKSPDLCATDVAPTHAHTHANTTSRAHLQHISIDAMRNKMKQLWFSSKAAFLRCEERALAETGRDTISAAEWCAEGDASEVSLRSGGGMIGIVRSCGDLCVAFYYVRRTVFNLSLIHI